MTSPKKRKADVNASGSMASVKQMKLVQPGNWKQFDEPVGKSIQPVIYLHDKQSPNSNRIVAFDIDYTVIKPKSGKRFATGSSDWMWLWPNVPEKLRQAYDDGWKVVLLSNQAGIEKGRPPAQEIETKIDNIKSELGIPLVVVLSTTHSHYRKPATGMWDFVVEECNGDVKVDLSECIYVGDAAGRSKDWLPGKPRDFSCGDRMFASNVGIKFLTPEEYFNGDSPTSKFSLGDIDPKELTVSTTKLGDYHCSKQEIIVMVGWPASGKSTFSKSYLVPHGYVRVNQDELGTASKCFKHFKEAIAKGDSVVVDNTNGTKSTRADYIKVAKDLGVGIRCFYMMTTRKLAHHMNLVRQNMTLGRTRRIPDVAFNMYKSKFVEPSTDEGFLEVRKIPVHVVCDDDRHRKLLQQYTWP